MNSYLYLKYDAHFNVEIGYTNKWNDQISEAILPTKNSDKAFRDIVYTLHEQNWNYFFVKHKQFVIVKDVKIETMFILCNKIQNIYNNIETTQQSLYNYSEDLTTCLNEISFKRKTSECSNNSDSEKKIAKKLKIEIVAPSNYYYRCKTILKECESNIITLLKN